MLGGSVSARLPSPDDGSVCLRFGSVSSLCENR